MVKAVHLSRLLLELGQVEPGASISPKYQPSSGPDGVNQDAVVLHTRVRSEPAIRDSHQAEDLSWQLAQRIRVAGPSAIINELTAERVVKLTDLN